MDIFYPYLSNKDVLKMYHTIIDIRKINDLNCGLGQFAFHLSKQLNILNNDHCFYLNKFDCKNKELKNLELSKKIHKTGYFYPDCRVWHAIHQDVDQLPLSKKIKVVLTIHDLNYLAETQDPKRKKKYIKKLQKKINRADYLTFVSEFALNDVKKYFNIDNKKCSVIYNGVCISDKQEKSRDIQPKQLESIDNFYFSIGTVVEKKNLHILLDLALEFPKENFVLAGSIFNQYGYDIIKRKEELKLSNLYILGNINEQEKIWLFSHCKALIHPSKLEGFGIPLIEAFSFGKAVFCSNVCSMPEVGGEHAFYFNPNDIDDIKKVLLKNSKIFPLSSKKQKELISYSRQFSWDRAATQYQYIYDNL